ncbi:MAG TPA: galactokinase [Anaerolineae bacterium]|nr:galactokinase [Anaerolineae bacterium]
MNLIDATRQRLKQRYPRHTTPPRFFRAPGRVNLIGEHTDYNDGFTLPAALNFETVVAAIPLNERRVEVFALDKNEADSFDLDAPITPHPVKNWANYVRGMAKTLLSEGKHLRGIAMAVSGNVPTSGGLSSSASFEMALGYAFLQLSGYRVNGVSLALSGQKTENNFVGVQCGIMDQFISALGQKDHALLIDCRDLSYKPIPIPPDTAIIVVDSGLRRGLVDSEYNTRRQQCQTAAAHFGVKALRDVDQAAFAQRAHELSALIRRRARHVITENARVLAAAQALAEGNIAQLGPLMAESQRSMREDFEITVPAIDTLVEILQSSPGVYGARMTGGGFGGSCVALSPKNAVPAIKEAVDRRYQAETGYRPAFYVCQAADGAGEIAVKEQE